MDLYSTYRSIIFGCQHSIEDLKHEVEDEVQLIQSGGRKARRKLAPTIVKHSKVEFREGRFIVKGDKLQLEKKIPEELDKM